MKDALSSFMIVAGLCIAGMSVVAIYNGRAEHARGVSETHVWCTEQLRQAEVECDGGNG